MPNDQKNIVAEAFEAASIACGGKPRMLAALNISQSWMHACIQRGRIPLILGLKLQILTQSQFNWQKLCPDEYEEINAVSSYLKI